MDLLIARTCMMQILKKIHRFARTFNQTLLAAMNSQLNERRLFHCLLYIKTYLQNYLLQKKIRPRYARQIGFQSWNPPPPPFKFPVSAPVRVLVVARSPCLYLAIGIHV